jgi:hypothetical protein
MITFEFQRSGTCSRWYAMKHKTCVGLIEKFDDTKTDTNPFKVSVCEGGRNWTSKIAFWPKYQDFIAAEAAAELQKGYFGNEWGALEEAKAYLNK